MAVYSFTRAIHQGEPIRVFNGGDMKRDFTFVDDIVRGVLGALDQPPALGGGAPHRLYNIGNNNPEPLLTLVALIEAALGRQAKIVFEPIPPGDVKETYADIDSIRRDLGFQPTTPLAVGIPEFVRWYLSYHGAVDGRRAETAG
jgi:UDP-glucuronate 4-epimerase